MGYRKTTNILKIYHGKMSGGKTTGTPVPGHIWDGYEGIKIAGDTWGNPNNQLVILQHGGGQTRHAWKGAGETLSRISRCQLLMVSDSSGREAARCR